MSTSTPSRHASLRRALLIGACALAATGAAWAQADWPKDQIITWVVPYPPGGSTDVLGRNLAQRVGPALGPRVSVDNKAGATGTRGAAYVATATPDGVPSARMMLLKGVREGHFVFFTNYESRKGGELARNKHAALVFHWSELQRSVRVEGTLERTSAADSAAYFHSRPRGSQIGAWASHQSAALVERDELENRVREIEQKYPHGEVPLPPFWGGFQLTPNRIEFWQGRAHRLHDRFQYNRAGTGWKITRLSP